MTALGLLRLIGLAAVAAAVLDPGCARPGRVRLDVSMAGDLPAPVAARALDAVRVAAPWAAVALETSAPAARDDDSVPARILIGDPAPVLRGLQARPADLAVQADDPALTLLSVTVPSRVVAGMRADVVVGISGLPATPGTVHAVLRDPLSGLEQGRADLTAAGPRVVDDQLTVSIPWIATRVGPTRLRASVSFEPASGDSATGSVRAAPAADVLVDVRPAEASVGVLEARPTWGARFARLALTGADGVRVRSEVRVAPGIAVRTDPTTRDRIPDDADVMMVGGVEALTSSDVARLDRDVRERGRAVVLIFDELPGTGAWQRLWPGDLGVVRSAPRPVTGLVAGHVWTMREWLSPVASTATTPLAYVDTGSPAFVMGRAHGAGRILLVTALDAWRWRAEEGTAFAAGWRALVQRLAADVPPPVGLTAWVSGDVRAERLHVDVAVRPDIDRTATVAVTAANGRQLAQSVPLTRVGDGRWRGDLRTTAPGPVRVEATATVGDRLVARIPAVVDVSPRALVATWADVERHQAARGAAAVAPAGLTAALQDLRNGIQPGEGRRWYATRTWWFAGLVLSLLGTEWILRRLHGER